MQGSFSWFSLLIVVSRMKVVRCLSPHLGITSPRRAFIRFRDFRSRGMCFHPSWHQQVIWHFLQLDALESSLFAHPRWRTFFCVETPIWGGLTAALGLFLAQTMQFWVTRWIVFCKLRPILCTLGSTVRWHLSHNGCNCERAANQHPRASGIKITLHPISSPAMCDPSESLSLSFAEYTGWYFDKSICRRSDCQGLKPSCSCNLCHSYWQQRILNPLHQAGDRTM